MAALSSSELKMIEEMRPILEEIEQQLNLGKKAILPTIQVQKIKKIARFHQQLFSRFSEGPLAEKLRPKQNSLFKLLLQLNSSDKKGSMTESMLSILLMITMFTAIIALTMFIGRGISSIHTQVLPLFGLFWVVVFIIQNWPAKKALINFERKLDSFYFELEYMPTIIDDEDHSQGDTEISSADLASDSIKITPESEPDENKKHP